MALLGDGLLAIWNDIDPAVEAEFTHWYISEHFAERVGLPGFLRARRYVAAAPGPGPRYAALYETETADVTEGPQLADDGDQVVSETFLFRRVWLRRRGWPDE